MVVDENRQIQSVVTDMTFSLSTDQIHSTNNVKVLKFEVKVAMELSGTAVTLTNETTSMMHVVAHCQIQNCQARNPSVLVFS